MNSIELYFIKVSLITATLYCFYRIALARSTYHALNRFILLFIIPFSLICPLLKISELLHTQIIDYNLWINEFQDFPYEDQILTSNTNIPNTDTYTNFLFSLYLLVVLFLCIRFMQNLYQIYKCKLNSIILHKAPYAFIYTDNFNAPFSFFNWIFLPTTYNTYKDSNIIIEHEKTHAKQWHSLDLIVSELYCIAFWFNPFVFLLKNSLKTIHEYQSDNAVIRKSSSIQDYLNTLISSTELSCLSGISNHFCCINLKKRIEMITNNSTLKFRKLAYLLIVPMIGLIVVSFSPENNSNNPPNMRPIEGGEITLKFGYQGIHPITKKEFTHQGVDIKASIGTPIHAAAAGTIVEATEKEGWGKLIVIKHDEQLETWYAHLNDFSIKPGEKVSQGQVIGHVGNTGYSTGPHVHYEVRKNGEQVNPEEYFK